MYHLVKRAFPILKLSQLFIRGSFVERRYKSKEAHLLLQNSFIQKNFFYKNLSMEISDNLIFQTNTINMYDDSTISCASIIQRILRFQQCGHNLEEALGEFSSLVSECFVWSVLQRFHSDWKSALYFYNWASHQQGHTHGYRVSNEMLDILGRMKQIELMLEIFNQIPKHNVNDKTFTILLNRISASHNVAKVVETFYKRKDYDMPIDLKDFQELLMCLCRYKHVEDAEALFLQKRTEFPPDIKSWNIILNGWCVLRSYPEAKRVWKDILSSGFKPDLFTYGTFINTLSKVGKITTAVKLFNKMRRKGYYPDVVICNCIIEGLCFKKKIPDALRIFDEISKHGCIPNVGTYNSLIKHICKIRRMDKAYELLEEMEQKGCLPDSRTFNYFLKTTKNPNEVDALLERMKNNGCTIDIDTYNLLLNLYVHWDHFSGIESLWSEMEKKCLGPDSRSYTIMIHGFYRKGKFDDTTSYFIEMQSKGMVPQQKTLMIMQQLEENKAKMQFSKE